MIICDYKNLSRQQTLSGFLLLLLFAATAAIGLSLDITESGRIEFIDGERHMFEHFAGIVGGGRNAFLFGNGIFRAVYEILRGALDAHDGEEAERDGKYLAVVLVGDSAVHTIANGFGEILHADVAVGAKLAYVENARIEYEGIHNLKNSGREIITGGLCVITTTEIL